MSAHKLYIDHHMPKIAWPIDHLFVVMPFDNSLQPNGICSFDRRRRYDLLGSETSCADRGHSNNTDNTL